MVLVESAAFGQSGASLRRVAESHSVSVHTVHPVRLSVHKIC